MKHDVIPRREMIESCIVDGVLVAGVVALSEANLLARWQQGGT